MLKYGVEAEDLESNGKISAFWCSGERIPLNERDRFIFGSYRELGNLLNGQQRSDIVKCLREMANKERCMQKDQTMNCVLYGNHGVLCFGKPRPD